MLYLGPRVLCLSVGSASEPCGPCFVSASGGLAAKDMMHGGESRQMVHQLAGRVPSGLVTSVGAGYKALCTLWTSKHQQEPGTVCAVATCCSSWTARRDCQLLLLLLAARPLVAVELGMAVLLGRELCT